MRLSHFRRLMDDEFGPGYATSVASDQVLGALGGRTPEQALAAGIDPGQVWEAVCDAMDVPASRRLGADPKRPPAGSQRPPGRARRGQT